MAKLIIFSAPSGSGKSTIINYLLTQNLNLAFSISATSRPPRGTEKDGVEYFFLTPDEFRRRIANDEFLEYTLSQNLNLIVCLERIYHCNNHKKKRRRRDTWYGNIPKSLPLSCSIQPTGLIQFCRNLFQCGKVKNHCVPDTLPYCNNDNSQKCCVRTLYPLKPRQMKKL